MSNVVHPLSLHDNTEHQIHSKRNFGKREEGKLYLRSERLDGGKNSGYSNSNISSSQKNSSVNTFMQNDEDVQKVISRNRFKRAGNQIIENNKEERRHTFVQANKVADLNTLRKESELINLNVKSHKSLQRISESNKSNNSRHSSMSLTDNI